MSEEGSPGWATDGGQGGVFWVFSLLGRIGQGVGLSGAAGHPGDRRCPACDPGLGNAELRAGQVGLPARPPGSPFFLRLRREESHASLSLCYSSPYNSSVRGRAGNARGTEVSSVDCKQKAEGSPRYNLRKTQSLSGFAPGGGAGNVRADSPRSSTVPTRCPVRSRQEVRTRGHRCPRFCELPAPFKDQKRGPSGPNRH